MRYFKYYLIALFLVLLFVPYAVVLIFSVKNNEKLKNDVGIPEILVYRNETGKVEKLNCYDYLCATVAGEMQANFHKEALKSQAIASFTYMINKMNYVNENPDTDVGHKGAYVCDDSTHCMAYMDKETARKKWGDAFFDKYYSNIEESVSAVLGKVITYNDKPINAVFHSMSCGVTQSAKEVWGSDVEYLVSIQSEKDRLAKDFETTVVFSKKDFTNIFETNLGVSFSKSPDCFLGEIIKTESGLVKQITVSDTVYAGTYIRKFLNLRSACFDAKAEGENVIFTVYGYGHGVGLSQNGANEMAKQGYNYEEILKHYYSGVIIKDYKI